ncbi:MAG TPA: hypothetical protein DCQ72_00275 [Methylophilaceae bacterium]|jgi:uncharacterized membrane protein YedE/YeeE|nr:hypothetical protein [Methylophilaceae bacterium]HAP04175.1 hypothetical protein [Methylophilaceae bacterium]HCC72209.1 hypothetical protein [Methylophilaceae bacterium]
MSLIISLLAGIIFGLGLIIAQMTNPSKIIGFLTLGENWDPSLLFVMASAVFISFFAFNFSKQKNKTILNLDFEIPKRTEIDLSLLVGAALFGIGWGIVGFCPAPAIVSIGFGNSQTLLFVISMLIGMCLVKIIKK